MWMASVQEGFKKGQNYLSKTDVLKSFLKIFQEGWTDYWLSIFEFLPLTDKRDKHK